VEVDDVLPDPGLIATAAGVVVLAVGIWAGISLVRGEFIQPLEAVMFALVFAFVYFGSLSVLGDGSD
jgi:hypothetical protein